MRTTANTSVIVASFASWHEHHAAAVAAIARVDLVISQCMLETYSVLTRLPAPHRVDAETVATYLRLGFGRHAVASLTAAEHRKLVEVCAKNRIVGGSVYDALVATTARRAGARILTLDVRARAIYTALGVTHEVIV